MSVGDAKHPLRVAIIGSGPSGFYAAEHLLSHDGLNVQVEMFDRLPTPFGLVRAGVAPDHPKIKSVTRVFDKVAANPNFCFRGNVEFGRNIEHEDLLEYFHAVIYCVGARSDRRLGIAREYLPGSHGASDFVGWYNASPDQRNLTFDFSGERVVVVGNGNVAMDVARVLMLPPEELAATDIGGHALRALSANKVREVTILGRRGPAQAAFTYRELRELAERNDIDVIVDPADMQLDPHSLHDTSHSADRGRDQVLDLLRELSERGDRGHDRRIVFRFLVSPVEIVGTNRVEGVDVVHNDLYRGNNGELRARATDRHEIVPADIVFRAIGYQGVALPGVPFDPITATIPNDRGRVIDSLTGQPREGEYVAPTGSSAPTSPMRRRRWRCSLRTCAPDACARRCCPPRCSTAFSPSDRARSSRSMTGSSSIRSRSRRVRNLGARDSSSPGWRTCCASCGTATRAKRRSPRSRRACYAVRVPVRGRG